MAAGGDAGEAEDLGPPSQGVAHIREHGLKHFNGVLTCSWTKNKGRVVHATREYQQGDIILVESPLHIVQEQDRCGAFVRLKQLCDKHPDDFDYEPLWYWCALQSLTKEQLSDAKDQFKASGWDGTDAATQHNLLLLHHEEVHKPSSSSEILSKQLVPSADPVLIERLTQVWVLNCFEYSDTPPGYSTYFFSSFMSHSCFPNAVWHYDGADHVLRARRDIKVGDEVCISYLTECGLLQSVPVRRAELHDTKRFWCTCERCAAAYDTSRGFVSPFSKDGVVFALCPTGPAQDAALLSSQLLGAECNKSHTKVTKAVAKKLSALETECQEALDFYTNHLSNGTSREIQLKDLQDREAWLTKHFAQHVLADLCLEQISEIYSLRGRLSDQRRLLELRCAFHQGAYPGLSGAHAWMLEAYGDAMVRSSSSSGSNISLGSTTSGKGAGRGAAAKKKVWEPTIKSDPKAAIELYDQSLDILRRMFGDKHEYVQQVVGKKRSATSSSSPQGGGSQSEAASQ
mmetsp:Transcript_36028/g.84494  ORF Transcript_36028/g.84494 Transcript_36028/m.84494 type:complete len:514 (-) Transcript_36028:22-1563(-)